MRAMEEEPAVRLKDTAGMDTLGSYSRAAPVVRTKLLPPRPPPRPVQIERLARRAPEILSHRLTIVRAPSGFGKTTLCAAWSRQLSEAGEQVAWVSFDVDDNQPSRALAYVLAALDSTDPGLGAEIREMLDREGTIPVQTVAALLINALVERQNHFVLFLDDFHLLTEPRFLQLVSYLLLRCPPNLHVVISCQARPGLPLTRLFVNDAALMVDGEDLRLRQHEARALLGLERGDFTGQEIDLLNEAMHGWVTGLKIGSAAMRHNRDAMLDIGPAAHCARWLSDYLKENIFQHLPARVQLFLMRCSVVEIWMPDICARLAGIDTADMLGWLADQNLFVQQLDDAGRIFRLHPVFREFLAEQLRQSHADELLKLHLEAARWYAENGLITEAIRHGVAAGDLNPVADRIEAASMGMVERFDLGTLLDIVARLPDAVLATRVKLRLSYIWALTITQRPQALAAMDDLDHVLSHRPAARVKEDKLALLAARACFTAMYEDDCVRSLNLAEQYLAQNQTGQTFAGEAIRNVAVHCLTQAGRYQEADRFLQAAPGPARACMAPMIEAYRYSVAGLWYRRQGLLAKAERTFRTGMARSQQTAGVGSASAAMNACSLAEILVEQGAGAQAAGIMDDPCVVIDEAYYLEVALSAYRAAVTLKLLARDRAGAERLLESAEQTGVERGWRRLTALAAVFRVRADFTQMIDLDGLLPQAEEEAALRNPASLPARIFIQLAEARWLLGWRAGDLARCRQITVRARHYCLATNAVGDLLRFDMLAARGLAADAGMPHAASAFADCLERCAQGGFFQMPLDSVSAPEWQEFGATPAADNLSMSGKASLRQILLWHEDAADRDAGFTAAPGDTTQSLFRILTAREIDIMLAVVNNASNKMIARQLHLTPETVKWHLKKIFRKLAANNRQEAIRQSMLLGLTIS